MTNEMFDLIESLQEISLNISMDSIVLDLLEANMYDEKFDSLSFEMLIVRTINFISQYASDLRLSISLFEKYKLKYIRKRNKIKIASLLSEFGDRTNEDTIPDDISD